MKTLRITLEGKSYEVGVELVDGGLVCEKPVLTSVQATIPVVAASAPAFPAQCQAAVTSENHPVVSPMPGVVVKIRAIVGQQVVRDQELLVLEAMKMESPICAPCSGSVSAILIKEGDTVNEGQILVQLS